LTSLDSELATSESCGSISAPSSCFLTFRHFPPILRTQFTSCPGNFSSNQTTVAQTCNVGNETAANVLFNQSVFSGCTPTSISSQFVTCSGGFCSGILGNLVSGGCSTVTISFDCSLASNQTSAVSFVSSFSSSENKYGVSSSSSPCSFTFVPTTICKIISIISDFDYDQFDLSPPNGFFSPHFGFFFGEDNEEEANLEEIAFVEHQKAAFEGHDPANRPTNGRNGEGGDNEGEENFDLELYEKIKEVLSGESGSGHSKGSHSSQSNKPPTYDNKYSASFGKRFIEESSQESSNIEPSDTDVDKKK
jgi:hypothetical protein